MNRKIYLICILSVMMLACVLTTVSNPISSANARRRATLAQAPTATAPALTQPHGGKP